MNASGMVSPVEQEDLSSLVDAVQQNTEKFLMGELEDKTLYSREERAVHTIRKQREVIKRLKSRNDLYRQEIGRLQLKLEGKNIERRSRESSEGHPSKLMRMMFPYHDFKKPTQ